MWFYVAVVAGAHQQVAVCSQMCKKVYTELPGRRLKLKYWEIYWLVRNKQALILKKHVKKAQLSHEIKIKSAFIDPRGEM